MSLLTVSPKTDVKISSTLRGMRGGEGRIAHIVDDVLQHSETEA